MTGSRRFPAPWRLVELTEAFRIEDASGFPVAYVYFCDHDDRRGSMSERMSKGEARRIAANVARLPELLIPRNDESPGAEAPGRAVDDGG